MSILFVEDLEWKMIYVGSAETEEHDQVLDTIYVGPIPEGRHMFVFQADPPDVTRIPEKDAVGVTVVLLTCSYRNQEFIRVGLVNLLFKFIYVINMHITKCFLDIS